MDICLGKGTNIKTHIRPILQHVLFKLSEIGVTVRCVSADTFYSPILLKYNDLTPNNVYGVRTEILKKTKSLNYSQKKILKANEDGTEIKVCIGNTTLQSTKHENYSSKDWTTEDSKLLKSIRFEHLGDFDDSDIPRSVILLSYCN